MPCLAVAGVVRTTLRPADAERSHMKHTAKYTVIVFCLKATAELIRENVGLQKEL